MRLTRNRAINALMAATGSACRNSDSASTQGAANARRSSSQELLTRQADASGTSYVMLRPSERRALIAIERDLRHTDPELADILTTRRRTAHAPSITNVLWSLGCLVPFAIMMIGAIVESPGLWIIGITTTPLFPLLIFGHSHNRNRPNFPPTRQQREQARHRPP